MRWEVAAGLVLLGVLGACSRGIYHRVQPGETLYRIGRAYGVPPGELARINGIDDPDHILAGQRLFIPGARRRLQAVAPPRRYTGTGRADGRAVPRFIWPLEGGTLSSRFGPRGALRHKGIDIAAPVGAPIRAAAAGTVVYSDELRGYGKVVIIDHGGGWATVYAHNAKNRVQRGRRVQRGEVIAVVGTTGRANGPNLHFEVRRHNVPRDPLPFLRVERTAVSWRAEPSTLR